jgi:primosomal replication protein N
MLKRSAIRYTPAGVPAIDIVVGHSSMQMEAGSQRKTRCEIDATAVGEMATRISAFKLNQPVQISGFLSQHGIGSRRLALHVVKVEAVSSGDPI